MREIIAAILSVEDEASRMVAEAAARGRAVVSEAKKKALEISEAGSVEARQAAGLAFDSALADALREKEVLLAAAAAEIEKSVLLQADGMDAAVDVVVKEVLGGMNAGG